MELKIITNYDKNLRQTGQFCNKAVYTVLGHMDDQVAIPAAKTLAEELKEPVVVVCGLHINNATKDDIKALIDNSNLVVNKAIIYLTKGTHLL